MSHSAITRSTGNSISNLRDLTDVNSSAIGDGKTLVWNAALGKHVYIIGGSGSEFDVNTIVTGTDNSDVITDDNGNIIVEG